MPPQFDNIAARLFFKNKEMMTYANQV